MEHEQELREMALTPEEAKLLPIEMMGKPSGSTAATLGQFVDETGADLRDAARMLGTLRMMDWYARYDLDPTPKEAEAMQAKLDNFHYQRRGDKYINDSVKREEWRRFAPFILVLGIPATIGTVVIASIIISQSFR